MIKLEIGKFGTYFRDELNNIDLTNKLILERLNVVDSLKNEIQLLKDREKKLVEALKIYAQLSNWRHRAYSSNEVERDCFDVYEDFQNFNNIGGENPVIKIKGKRAREVLKELGVEL